ncbi:Acetylcholine receptor subunit beta-like 1, partial [Eumeta japonica]
MEMPGSSAQTYPTSYGSPAEMPKQISHRRQAIQNGTIMVGEKVNHLILYCSPEASKATEAVEFIAEHLRNEDLYT